MRPGPEPGRLDLRALFGNDRPVEVDAGCGKGLFLVQEAAARPGVNFIGVDRLCRKIDRAFRRVKERGLRNVRLFHCDVFHFIDGLLPRESIAAFYVYFPDPWPKRRHRRRRFVDGSLVRAWARALVADGHVWIATDHREYFHAIQGLFDSEPAFQPARRRRPPVTGLSDFERDFLEAGVPLYRAGYRRVGRIPLLRGRHEGSSVGPGGEHGGVHAEDQL